MAEKLYGLTENKAWKEIPDATVDSEVTAGGTNAVSGAAVAAYTAASVTANGSAPVSGKAVYDYVKSITDFEGVTF